MADDGAAQVRVLGSTIDYADGAEDEILAVMRSVGDRSSDSDELAAHIRDWPTMYHFSRRRRNLLRPLRWRSGMRVLDVGAGTGAIARYLGEQGVAVTALEGAMARARAAAARCAGLRVDVACGTLADLARSDGAGSFDAVTVIGVLEYAAKYHEGGAADFLRQVVDQLGRSGVLVLAIENQIGLKYLLGYDEDHLALPWLGVEGYLGVDTVRTWSRRELSRVLSAAGLTEQRWLYPYPDYKTPSVVLSDRLFARDDAAGVIDQLLVAPVSGEASAQHLVCDQRAAHRVFLDAGLGPDVANSFLVVASGSAEGVGALAGEDLAWLYGDERARRWSRARTLRDDGRALSLRSDVAGDEVREDGWLRQHVSAAPAAFIAGRGLDSLVLEALADSDLSGAEKLLRQWSDAVDEQASAEVGGAELHPFSPVEGEHALPGRLLDVNLSNFVVSETSGLVYVDDEWETAGLLSAPLARIRALWSLALSLATRGRPHPWSSDATVGDLTMALGALIDAEPTAEQFDRFLVAESELQSAVTGRDRHDLLARLREMRDLSGAGAARPMSHALRAAAADRRLVNEANAALRHELEQLRAVYAAECDTTEALRGEIAAIYETRTFRWSESARRAYRKLRKPRR